MEFVTAGLLVYFLWTFTELGAKAQPKPKDPPKPAEEQDKEFEEALKQYLSRGLKVRVQESSGGQGGDKKK